MADKKMNRWLIAAAGLFVLALILVNAGGLAGTVDQQNVPSGTDLGEAGWCITMKYADQSPPDVKCEPKGAIRAVSGLSISYLGKPLSEIIIEPKITFNSPFAVKSIESGTFKLYGESTVDGAILRRELVSKQITSIPIALTVSAADLEAKIVAEGLSGRVGITGSAVASMILENTETGRRLIAFIEMSNFRREVDLTVDAPPLDVGTTTWDGAETVLQGLSFGAARTDNTGQIVDATVSSCYAPCTVEYWGIASQGKPVFTYNVQFSDGQQFTGSLTAEPFHFEGLKHTYSAAGTYQPKLTVIDSVGTNIVSTITIKVEQVPLSNNVIKFAIKSGTLLTLSLDKTFNNGGQFLGQATSPNQWCGDIYAGTNTSPACAGITQYSKAAWGKTYYVNWGAGWSFIFTIDQPEKKAWFNADPQKASAIGWAAGVSIA